MFSINSKQLREYQKEFCSKPGYVLNFNRKEFAELVEETIDEDIYEVELSNEKRLIHLLQTCESEKIELLITALRKHK